MELTDYFVIGDTVSVEIKDNTSIKSYDCVIKNITGELIGLAFTLPSDPHSHSPASEDVVNNTSVKINTSKAIEPLSFRIVSNRTFPTIIVKLKELLPSPLDREIPIGDFMETTHPSDEMNLYEKKSDSEDKDDRTIARIKDHFKFNFELVREDEVEILKREYTIRPSSAREQISDEAKYLHLLNKSPDLDSLLHLNPALTHVINDIYDRINLLASRVIKSNTIRREEQNSALCLNISGSGLKFLTSKELSTGNIVKIILSRPLANPFFTIVALGKVIWIKKIKSQSNIQYKYTAGVSYYAINEDDMEIITHYSFQLQQELLRLRSMEKDMELD